MSDLKESFNDYKNFRKRIISNKKKSSTNILLDILSNNKDYTYKVITDYHYSLFRICDNYRIDFYPNTNKYHIVSTGIRGIVKPEDLLHLFN